MSDPTTEPLSLILSLLISGVFGDLIVPHIDRGTQFLLALTCRTAKELLLLKENKKGDEIGSVKAETRVINFRTQVVVDLMVDYTGKVFHTPSTCLFQSEHLLLYALKHLNYFDSMMKKYTYKYRQMWMPEPHLPDFVIKVTKFGYIDVLNWLETQCHDIFDYKYTTSVDGRVIDRRLSQEMFFCAHGFQVLPVIKWFDARYIAEEKRFSGLA